MTVEKEGRRREGEGKEEEGRGGRRGMCEKSGRSIEPGMKDKGRRENKKCRLISTTTMNKDKKRRKVKTFLPRRFVNHEHHQCQDVVTRVGISCAKTA